LNWAFADGPTARQANMSIVGIARRTMMDPDMSPFEKWLILVIAPMPFVYFAALTRF